MAGRSRGGSRPLASGATSAGPGLVPCVLLKGGNIYVPSADGPVPARNADGGSYDPFDVVDRLVEQYPLLYLADLDGIERGEPQLDFLQELSRGVAMWVDGGVRTADQAIDILVAGAQRAVLSSALLKGPRELRRAWRLSPELAFELELDSKGLVARSEWETSDPRALAATVRAVGLDHLVVSPREIDPDWALVGDVAASGPTWVDGSFEVDQLPLLRSSGARGGIFHVGRLLATDGLSLRSEPTSGTNRLRDDEA